MRVLIVDRDQAICEALKLSIEVVEPKAEVECYNSLASALPLIKDESFRKIVLIDQLTFLEDYEKYDFKKLSIPHLAFMITMPHRMDELKPYQHERVLVKPFALEEVTIYLGEVIKAYECPLCEERSSDYKDFCPDCYKGIKEMNRLHAKHTIDD